MTSITTTNTTQNSIHRKKPQAKNNTWSCSTSSHYLNTLNQHQNFMMSTTPIEKRIDLYEHKYQSCMQSTTSLSRWIKSNKEKGPPEPLTEGYSPPSRSRLPDFLFSSLSTRSKRKSEQPTAISSLSTFLKKATNYKNNSSNANLAALSTTTTTTTSTATSTTTSTSSSSQHHRFSLTSSLNRFSLQKNSYSNITDKYNSTIDDRRHRFSISPPDDKKSNYIVDIMTSASDVTHNKKQRPQSTILPHSPSSVFLDRLRSRTPSHDYAENPSHSIQPNTTSKFARIITHGGDFAQDDNITPPSSPSSTDSSLTPPLLSQFNHHHYLRQSGKSVTQEKKKKRASLLITPSLSAIRLLPQKSNFLKRQSMLA